MMVEERADVCCGVLHLRNHLGNCSGLSDYSCWESCWRPFGDCRYRCRCRWRTWLSLMGFLVRRVVCLKVWENERGRTAWFQDLLAHSLPSVRGGCLHVCVQPPVVASFILPCCTNASDGFTATFDNIQLIPIYVTKCVRSLGNFRKIICLLVLVCKCHVGPRRRISARSRTCNLSGN